MKNNAFGVVAVILILLFVVPNALSLLIKGKWAWQDYDDRQRQELRDWEAKQEAERRAREQEEVRRVIERERKIWNGQR